MQVHGFRLHYAQRAAAAYQAYQDHSNSGGSVKNYEQYIGQGLWNFLSNSGDSEGDKELIESGWRYADEVYQNNPSDTNSVSCVDLETINNADNSGGGGGDGEYVYIVSCELWRFPDGNWGYYYVWRNCTRDYYWTQP